MSLAPFFVGLAVLCQIPPNLPGDNCPGVGDCCEFTGTPGCNNSTCCNLVCNALPACCDIGWSQDCVNLAGSLCGDVCPALGCPNAGSCCTTHESGGCSDAACCETVCAADADCCSSAWTEDCVTTARALCGTLCNTAPGCPGTGSCCRVHSSPGCDDSDCCAIVCAHDAFCCRGKWDDLCARTANNFCGAADGTYCEWCPNEGSCCVTHGTPGCDKEACCRAICSANSFCCTTFWGSSCANQAAQLCAPSVCGCDDFGDLNADGAKNLIDVAGFFACFTGAAGGPIDENCACADDEGDGDVDLDDYGAFAPLLTNE